MTSFPFENRSSIVDIEVAAGPNGNIRSNSSILTEPGGHLLLRCAPDGVLGPSFSLYSDSACNLTYAKNRTRTFFNVYHVSKIEVVPEPPGQ